MNYGWCGTIESLIKSDIDDIRNQVENYIHLNNLKYEREHEISLIDCLNFLHKHLKNLSGNLKQHYIILEYKMDDGRRPDIIIPTQKKLFIIEHKMSSVPKPAHFTQLSHYARNIKNYHKLTWNKNLEIIDYLLFTGRSALVNEQSILNDRNFTSFLEKNLDLPLSKEGVLEWVESRYEPIPSITSAVTEIFTKENLSEIMKSKSNIVQTMNYLKEQVLTNKSNRGINIFFVSGSPGSGKTLVGLKLLRDLIKEKNNCIYLSGNKTLVEVLQHQVDSVCNSKSGYSIDYGKSIIKRVDKYIDNHIIFNNKVNYKELDHQTIIFDESQRIWDSKKMSKKFSLSDKSEADVLLNLARQSVQNNNKLINFVCLVGDGQEIHEGEERGILTWTEAINKMLIKTNFNINIYCPEKFKPLIGMHVVQDEKLNLTNYLRGHESNLLPIWVDAVLDNKIDEAKKVLEKINKLNTFPIFICNDLSVCKKHLRDIYSKTTASYGLILSSHIKRAMKNRINPGGIVDIKNYGEWFSKECTKLDSFVTQFDVQGLELDTSVVYFGGDFRYDYNGGGWKRDTIIYWKEQGNWKFREKLENFLDKEKIIRNIYRVLLTRGRDSLILYIPKDEKLKDTYKFFKDLGVKELI
ncbi:MULTISPECIES: DNA/RNA helicase domain-containing protein [unclassified Priestia]|uniref:DNA/RNA helicase domain-containing protein n=1 Tax=unclassified Priestia TaxID=2800374 RepID=UPI00366EDE4B